MLYREIIAVCSKIHTNHINTLLGESVEFVNVKLGGTYSNHWYLRSPCSVEFRFLTWCSKYSYLAEWGFFVTNFSFCFIRLWNFVSHINPLNAELNPICYLLALLEAHHFLHVSRIRVKGRKEFVGFCEWSSEEDIWTEEGGSGRWLDKTALFRVP